MRPNVSNVRLRRRMPTGDLREADGHVGGGVSCVKHQYCRLFFRLQRADPNLRSLRRTTARDIVAGRVTAPGRLTVHIGCSIASEEATATTKRPDFAIAALGTTIIDASRTVSMT